MLKMYHPATQLGGSPEFWEENWGDQGFDLQLRFCALDPLRPLLEHHAQPGTMMLEGGCGMGQYVSYYSARGVHIVGLDFAGRTLAKLHTRQPDLMLCRGNVAALPFRDNSFDTYYSGGVMEHFEGGASIALQEAHRVLRPNGILLISVPYLSPLRRLLSVKRDEWKSVSTSELADTQEDHSLQFFQYAYTIREFKELLRAAGFRVLSTRGYAVLWGLQELPLVGGALRRTKYSGGPEGENGSGSGDAILPARASRPIKVVLKRLIVSEDDTVPILGVGVRILRWACANMMMYVCARVSLKSTA